MRKLIPVLIFTFSGSIAFAQSGSDRIGDGRENGFAESLRLEIVSGIKKKMSSDTSFQKSQETMNEYYKACGLTPSIQKCAQPEPAKSFKAAPETITVTITELNRSIAAKKHNEAVKEN